MKISSNEAENSHLLLTAEAMATAARTAPKGKGVDHIQTLILTGEDLQPLILKMKELHQKTGKAFLYRDAKNLEQSPVILLVGTTLDYRGIDPCGNCGYDNCSTSAEEGGICLFDPIDLGIALGYACSTAMLQKVDFRIFHSAGIAAKELVLLPECRILYGIPLSATGKDIYHDRG